MKLTKRIQGFMKVNGFKLKPRSKEVKIPREYYVGEDRPKVAFYGAWLLQVLEKKGWRSDKDVKDQGYQLSGWGGGRSGLSEEELRELNKVFQFRGMGYAEYEGGKLGESYRFLINNFDQLVFSEVTLYKQKFYTLCLNYHAEFMEPTLHGVIANNQFPVRISKEEIRLHKVIQEQDKNFVGAWNIDSHYVFFTNKARFLKFKKLLKAQSQTQSQKVA